MLIYPVNFVFQKTYTHIFIYLQYIQKTIKHVRNNLKQCERTVFSQCKGDSVENSLKLRENESVFESKKKIKKRGRAKIIFKILNKYCNLTKLNNCGNINYFRQNNTNCLKDGASHDRKS